MNPKGTMMSIQYFILEYFSKMRSLGDQMVAVGESLDDEELIAYVLNGLDI